MKELSIEEKSRRYDEAIERAKSKINNDKDHVLYEDDVIEIFPELKESEDEKVRKEIISFIQDDINEINFMVSGDYDERDSEDIKHEEWCKKAIAWLEKQGKGKLTDKPKFKIGDWIVQENVGVYKVIEVCESWYEVIDNKDKHYSIGFDKEYMCHLWTIQDAKPGDVLCTPNGNTFIFKTIDGDKILDYCGLYFNKFFSDCGSPNGSSTHYDKCNYHPATKEQRDLLFQKMKEAGYEWDAENLQLTKILPVKELSDGINIDKQKLVEWSEEDEKVITGIINDIQKRLEDYPLEQLAEIYFKEIKWLKSIKERYTWKPSDEQITVLELASKYERVFTPKQIDILIGLKEQLKKLRGE